MKQKKYHWISYKILVGDINANTIYYKLDKSYTSLTDTFP